MAYKKSAINVIAIADSLKVNYLDRSLTIQLEPLNNEAGNNSHFFIELDEIEYWDAPDNTKTISIVELQKILEAIEIHAEKKGKNIEFE